MCGDVHTDALAREKPFESGGETTLGGNTFTLAVQGIGAAMRTRQGVHIYDCTTVCTASIIGGICLL